MIFALRTKPWDADRDHAIRSSSSRSPSVNEIARSCGRPMRDAMIRPPPKAQERIMNPFANYVNLFAGRDTSRPTGMAGRMLFSITSCGTAFTISVAM